MGPLGEELYWYIRCYELLKQHHQPVNDKWISATKSSLDSLMKIYPNGNVPGRIDGTTGKASSRPVPLLEWTGTGVEPSVRNAEVHYDPPLTGGPTGFIYLIWAYTEYFVLWRHTISRICRASRKSIADGDRQIWLTLGRRNGFLQYRQANATCGARGLQRSLSRHQGPEVADGGYFGGQLVQHISILVQCELRPIQRPAPRPLRLPHDRRVRPSMSSSARTTLRSIKVPPNSLVFGVQLATVYGSKELARCCTRIRRAR